MDASLLHRAIIEPALEWLLPDMDSPEARRMLIAIAGQESGFRYRRQIRGPARGWWQFELGGVVGIRTHTATRDACEHVLAELGYDPQMPSGQVFVLLEDCDLLAACFARLNLRWLPWPLPTDEGHGWEQYAEAWRPGKPHPDRWPANWGAASEVV